MKRQVVITGIGVISAAGEGVEALWQAVLSKNSLVGPLDFGPTMEDWHPIGAHHAGFDPERYISRRKALKVMARDIQLAVAAASLSIADSRIDLSKVDHHRIGVIVGSGILNQELDELAPCVHESMDEKGRLDLKKFGANGLPALFPLWLLKYLPNMPACHISIFFDLQGVNNTLTTGSSCGLQAIGEAYRIIERGDADLMLAGAAESKTNPVGLSRYEILKLLVHFDGKNPKKAYRPFDSTAGGFVVGEGAAFLILEELSHAQTRGARIYGQVAAAGSSYYEGRSLAMKKALEEAQIKASQIDLVVGCGLGVAEEDQKEFTSLTQVFGNSRSKTPICFSKPVTGFTGYASGTFEAALSLMALKTQTVPPSLNAEAFNSPSLSVLSEKKAGQPLSAVMTNAFGLGGQSVSMITKRFG